MRTSFIVLWGACIIWTFSSCSSPTPSTEGSSRSIDQANNTPQQVALPPIPEGSPETMVTGKWKVIDMQDGGMIEQVSAQLPPAQAQAFRNRMNEMVISVKQAGYRSFRPDGTYLNLVGKDTVMAGIWMVINNGKALLTKPLNSQELPNQFTLRSLAHDAMVIEEPLNFPGPDTIQSYITTFILQKEKIEFPMTSLDKDGLYGTGDGKRSVSYEFCIPSDSAFLEEVQRIEPNIKVMAASQGRIGCEEGWWLCIGETNANYPNTLPALARQAYINRIVETVFE